jgi:diacylglycerol kinase (ATP)
VQSEIAVTRNVPAAVFVNPFAGGGRAAPKCAEAREAFVQRNYAVKFFEASSAREFRLNVHRAISEGCDTFVALGGDGTLQLLVTEIFGRDVRVGVIPAGGGNDFASALGIPTNVQHAVAVIAEGNSRPVDLLQVRTSDGKDYLYLGGGGIGLDAEAARHAGGKFMNWPGRLRYVASAITALQGFSGVEVDVEFPETELPGIAKRVLLAAVLNTPSYGGGLRLAPGAELDDGLLEVVLLEMLGAREILALLPRLLFTGELKTGHVTRLRTQRVRITPRSEAWFHGDGELLGPAPVDVQVLHKKLCVLTRKSRC